MLPSNQATLAVICLRCSAGFCSRVPGEVAQSIRSEIARFASVKRLANGHLLLRYCLQYHFIVLAVLDTNIVFSALRSRRGASFKVLSKVGMGAFEIAVSVPLVLEYEDVCMRKLDELALDAEDVQAILDYVCSVARHQHIFFLWRPLLRDPKDDMVAELAFASGCDVIVTHNRRDFEQVESLGVRVVGPAVFLRELES